MPGPKRGAESTDARFLVSEPGQPHAILVGRSTRRHRVGDQSFHARRYLALPNTARPELLVPAGTPGPLRHALESRLARGGLRGLRNRLIARAVENGVVPASRRIMVLERSIGQPFLIRAASAQLGIPEDVDWYLSPRQEGPLYRSVFHLFRAGESQPAWVLKFNRVPGHAERFDRDENGLRAAAVIGDRVTRHAPELIGRFEAEGLQASVETAATGKRLRDVLSSSTTSTDAKLARVRQIARWLVEVARTTRRESRPDDPDREWLARDVVPGWPALAGSEVLSKSNAAPRVFRHGDPHAWNAFVHGDTFTLVDWEDAHERGYPLWDLLLFLADALAVMHGAAHTTEERTEHTVRLCRGELDMSGELFDWVDQAASASGVPPGSVGPLAILLWVSVAHSAKLFAARQSEQSAAAAAPLYSVLLAERWLADPALGIDWPARKRSR